MSAFCHCGESDIIAFNGDFCESNGEVIPKCAEIPGICLVNNGRC